MSRDGDQALHGLRISPEPATPKGAGFILDDAVLKPRAAEAAAQKPLRLDGSDARPPAPRGAARIRRGPRARSRPPSPAPGSAGLAEPRPGDSVTARGLPLALACFGAALLLVGVLVLSLKRESLGSDPLAAWRPSPGSAPAPAAGRADGEATPGSAPAAPAVRRIEVPAVPGPLAARRPAATVPELPARPAPEVARGGPGRDESDEDTLFALAEEHRQLGETAQAEQLYRRLLRESRQQGRAALALGDLHLGAERYDEAREMFELARRRYETVEPARAARE